MPDREVLWVVRMGRTCHLVRCLWCDNAGTIERVRRITRDTEIEYDFQYFCDEHGVRLLSAWMAGAHA